jgi:hypothetical protein
MDAPELPLDTELLCNPRRAGTEEPRDGEEGLVREPSCDTDCTIG